MLVFSAIVAHPPVSVPGIGKKGDFDLIKKTIDSYTALRKSLELARPDTVIIISPHAYMQPYSFVINSQSELVGTFANFGLDEDLSFENDIELSDQINYACQVAEMPSYLHGSFLDHGALIPLFHLLQNIKPKVVHLSFSLMDYESHFRYGQLINNVIDRDKNKRIAVIASGDLSHRLEKDSPAGFFKDAHSFDQRIIYYLGKNDITSLIGVHEELAIESAECGIRSIMILMGILHGLRYEFKLLSYESPFGVGYLMARLL